MTSAARLTELVDEVFRLSDALTRAGDAIVAEDGFTASRWLTLGAIAHGPLSVAGIARRRGMRRQSASGSVVYLEAAGLVERVPDPGDARAPLVNLTQEGRRTLERIRPRRLAWATRTSRVAGEEEIAAAIEVLRRLRTVLAVSGEHETAEGDHQPRTALTRSGEPSPGLDDRMVVRWMGNEAARMRTGPERRGNRVQRVDERNGDPDGSSAVARSARQRRTADL